MSSVTTLLIFLCLGAVPGSGACHFPDFVEVYRKGVHAHRCGNILRFPREAVEPPCAAALRGLAYAFHPAGVSVYFLRWRGAFLPREKLSRQIGKEEQEELTEKKTITAVR